MASIEVIGLLCAGTTRYHEPGCSSRASGNDLTRAELAGLLAGLSTAQMALALAKYGDDVDSERALIAHVRVWAAGVAVRNGWQVVKGRPTITNMAALAVFDVVRPNRCSHCHGTEMVGHRVCRVCSGTGYKPLSGRRIAEAIGVDECNYRRTWKARYESIMAYVQSIDFDICMALRSADKVQQLHCC